MSTETAKPSMLLAAEPRHWYDRLASWVADRTSPILLKEFRQALKSRQFVIFYSLLLAAVVLWTFWGLQWARENDNEQPGPMMLMGYLTILSFALMLGLPISCFSSLSKEFADETIQLVSITTMSAFRIVNGKLVSALLQMVLYLSVLTPCIGFTYLLHAVDLARVFQVLVYLMITCVSLCSLGLLMGGMCKSPLFRAVIGIGFILLCWFSFMGWQQFLSFSFLEDVFEMERQPMGVVFLWIASVGVLCYVCAVSAISFPAENRSTRIRVAMLFVQTMIVFGVFWLVLQYGMPPSPQYAALSVLTTFFWLIMGSMMVAEGVTMSYRVRRDLPRTISGRSFRSLLLPGPGRGYLFASANIIVWTGLFVAGQPCFTWLCRTLRFGATEFTSQSGLGIMTPSWIEFILLNAVHAMLFLSLTYLAVRFLRRLTPMGPVGGLMAGALIFVIVHLGTAALHIASEPSLSQDFSLWMTGNWIAMIGSFMQVGYNGSSSYVLYSDHGLMVDLLCLSTLIVSAWATVWASKELTLPPVATPARVEEESDRIAGRLRPAPVTAEQILAD